MADIYTETEQLAAATRAAFIALRTLVNGNEVDLSTLNTTTKTDLVSAINEVLVTIGTIEAGGIADGNKGSLTVSGTGTTWTINTGAVTNDMLAGSIADSKISSAATWNAKGNGTVTTISFPLTNGVTGVVTNATTTPSVALTLYDITPDSVNGVVLSGSSAPTLAVTGTSSISGANTGDQTNITGNAGTVTTINGRIVAGTNITITGSGTAASPYSIAASGGSGSVTTVSMPLTNGVVGVVTNPTTTPSIAVTLYDITPDSVNGVVLSGTSAPTLAVTGTSSISGANTGDQTTITGNAGSATVLQTARTINGVSFNGSANITVTAAGSTLSDTVPIGKGGTGLTALGTALQVLRVNAGATALEYATLSGGGNAQTADPLSQFAATTSAQLAGVISDETGSGALVFANSPTLVTPALGTPASGVLSSCTGLREPWVFLLSGPLVTDVATTGRKAWFRVTQACTLAAADVSVDAVTAPTVTAFTADIEKNGTSIYSTRPAIATTELSSRTGAGVGGTMTTDPTSFAVGDIVGIWVDIIGSTGAGFSMTAGFKF